MAIIIIITMGASVYQQTTVKYIHSLFEVCEINANTN